ncbi:2-phospho-L-lactate guanylyltransferase [Modestobacter sp. Leaf380]|uniref:2-phospho-L-lactate guanylyltransferase n=1 Tax=Modestobacter sp. Leaf380 TaxID=1736356 RepID=UPI0009EA9F90|nr:2-phospho-L-lactate guanylyltransferase [Modestobacter sp. Leaf380]
MQGWSVVVPAKRLALAKTRLGPVGDRRADHEDLVLALLGDTLEAALASPAVGVLWVVTDEPRAAGLARALGARVVPDAPAAGLNAALAHGAAVAGGAPVAALHSDLPALRPAELTGALLAAAGHERSSVTDAEGTGTTLLAVTRGELRPAFGAGSATAHAAGGAVPLAGDWPGLRRDVDTVAHLAVARALGTGPRTAVARAGPDACA